MNEYEKAEISYVYQEYGTLILRMCYIYLGTKELAEDALQETFLRVCRGYSDYRSQSSLKTWLTRIAINVCLDMIKARKKTDTVSMYDQENNIIEFQSPEARVDIETKVSLTECINTLPLELRQIVILFYYMEYNTREISEILDIKRSKVEFDLKKARSILKVRMKGVSSNEENIGYRDGLVGFKC